MSQFREKLVTDERTDERTNRRTDERTKVKLKDLQGRSKNEMKKKTKSFSKKSISPFKALISVKIKHFGIFFGSGDVSI